jgi:hypothetical protein
MEARTGIAIKKMHRGEGREKRAAIFFGTAEKIGTPKSESN